MPRAGPDRRVEAENQIGATTSPQIKFVRFLYEKELAEIAAEHAAANGNGSHEPLRYCHCAELVIAGRRIPAPKFPSCNYVVQRNGLIRDAERIATEKFTVRLFLTTKRRSCFIQSDSRAYGIREIIFPGGFRDGKRLFACLYSLFKSSRIRISSGERVERSALFAA
jgi:hypothetical protein